MNPHIVALYILFLCSMLMSILELSFKPDKVSVPPPHSETAFEAREACYQYDEAKKQAQDPPKILFAHFLSDGSMEVYKSSFFFLSGEQRELTSRKYKLMEPGESIAKPYKPLPPGTHIPDCTHEDCD